MDQVYDFVRPFFQLSYPVPTPARPDSFPNAHFYVTGPLDWCFIATCVAGLTLAREVVYRYIMIPLANQVLFGHYKGIVERSKRTQNGNGSTKGKGNGHNPVRPISKKDSVRQRNVTRFAEQGWSFTYATFAWLFGVYVNVNIPGSSWRLEHLWINLPNLPLSGPLKAYYLIQLAFWFHQVVVLNTEARRKDHWQMLTHHVITIWLVTTSYHQGFTRVGCLILVLMDFCDIILPAAKMLRYLEMPAIFTDMMFVSFLISWFLTRHVAFCLVLYSTAVTMPSVRPMMFKVDNDHINGRQYYFFLVMLGTLQVIMCGWFVAIVRVAWSVIRGKPADDNRSDDEELPPSDDEKDKETKKKR